MDVCKAKCRKSFRTFTEALLNICCTAYTSSSDGTVTYSFSFDEVGNPIACRKNTIKFLLSIPNNKGRSVSSLRFFLPLLFYRNYNPCHQLCVKTVQNSGKPFFRRSRARPHPLLSLSSLQATTVTVPSSSPFPQPPPPRLPRGPAPDNNPLKI
jgi:hypothetical protein